MRILCDHHVATKYVQAFEQDSQFTVSTVRDVLSPDAPDAEIATVATADDWVVFTSDDDFFHPTVPHGLVVYSQVEDPDPGDVVAALRMIEDAYESTSEITEFVPSGWI